MNLMSTRRVNPRQPDGFQALNQSEHRHGLRRFRHLAHPGQPALAGFLTALRQSIQLAPLIGGQSIGQTAMDCPPRLVAGLNQSRSSAPGDGTTMRRRRHSSITNPAR